MTEKSCCRCRRRRRRRRRCCLAIVLCFIAAESQCYTYNCLCVRDSVYMYGLEVTAWLVKCTLYTRQQQVIRVCLLLFRILLFSLTIAFPFAL